jgi:hypothetical protein
MSEVVVAVMKWVVLVVLAVLVAVVVVVEVVAVEMVWMVVIKLEEVVVTELERVWVIELMVVVVVGETSIIISISSCLATRASMPVVKDAEIPPASTKSKTNIHIPKEGREHIDEGGKEGKICIKNEPLPLSPLTFATAHTFIRTCRYALYIYNIYNRNKRSMCNDQF